MAKVLAEVGLTACVSERCCASLVETLERCHINRGLSFHPV